MPRRETLDRSAKKDAQLSIVFAATLPDESTTASSRELPVHTAQALAIAPLAQGVELARDRASATSLLAQTARGSLVWIARQAPEPRQYQEVALDSPRDAIAQEPERKGGLDFDGQLPVPTAFSDARREPHESMFTGPDPTEVARCRSSTATSFEDTEQ